MHNLIDNEPIEPFYMNQLPFPVREASKILLKNYMLDQLLTMRLDKVTPNLSAQFQLTPEQWQIALNHVILTKITYFHIHNQLPKSYLLKLVEIIGFVLDKPKTPIDILIEEVNQDATVMQAWLRNLQKALKRAR